MIIDGKSLAKKKKRKTATGAERKVKKKQLKPGVVAKRQSAPVRKRSRGMPDTPPSAIVESASLPPATPTEAVDRLVTVLQESRIAHMRTRGERLARLVDTLRATETPEANILEEATEWLKDNP